MPLSPSTLSSQLQTMEPTDSEAAAIQALANCWETFFSAAMCGPIPIVTPILAGPKALMITAMTGLSTAGAVSLQAGILAWWGGCSAAAPALFPTCTLIAPPVGLSGLSAALTTVFLANTVAKLEKPAACDAIAAVLYSTGALGGLGTIPMPAPTPTPIL